MASGTTPQKSTSLLAELKKHVRADKAAFFPKFFQDFPGGYGEGDRFLGIVVPDIRRVAGAFRNLPLEEIRRALHSPWHEMRLTALVVLSAQFERAKDAVTKKSLVGFYLQNLDGVNNWDLVDDSSRKILGNWLCENPSQRKILHRLARSKNLWEQRIAVVANYPLLKQHEFDDLLAISERMLQHPHDLIHKATGWMLREAGKVELPVLRLFLDKYAGQMPRTMLRYAIEKLPVSTRKSYMQR